MANFRERRFKPTCFEGKVNGITFPNSLGGIHFLALFLKQIYRPKNSIRIFRKKRPSLSSASPF